MRTLYVVTHPEATHHVEGVVGGWHDSELTAAGTRAAARAARALRSRIPQEAEVELYSSDLRRCRQTAEPVAALLGLRPVWDPRLREKSYGEAEGRPQAWLDRRFVPPPATGERMDHDEGVPGAETKAACARRVHAAMDDILSSPAEHQIIVTHGGSLTFVVTAWIKFPLEAAGHAAFGAAPGSITTLHEDDYFHNRRLAALGDTHHLDIP
ncbi:histidine phosphatase family protein [Streptomyces albidoflavus]|uniref:histidine phosphatase family protein n=1 Tax=Streptomyces albidoflavus TaxID=1886 RepID=UPI00386F8AF2|nr:histidine phosphatase family protein [Streptomyces albidoflavus]